jgi:Camelysin metallo-endopeptidase
MHKRLLLGAVLAIGILSESGAHGTLARFTTVVTSQGNTFSAGNLKIAEHPTTTTLSMGDLIPGDNFAAQLDLSNTGTLDFTYAMTTSITDSATLAHDLQLTVRTKSPSIACSDPDSGAEVLYGPGALSDAAWTNRPLPVPTGQESLCFSVLLPSGAPTSDQGQSVAATFTFLARQA